MFTLCGCRFETIFVADTLRDFRILSVKCEQRETEQGNGKSKSFPANVLLLYLSS